MKSVTDTRKIMEQAKEKEIHIEEKEVEALLEQIECREFYISVNQRLKKK